MGSQGCREARPNLGQADWYAVGTRDANSDTDGDAEEQEEGSDMGGDRATRDGGSELELDEGPDRPGEGKDDDDQGTGDTHHRDGRDSSDGSSDGGWGEGTESDSDSTSVGWGHAESQDGTEAQPAGVLDVETGTGEETGLDAEKEARMTDDNTDGSVGHDGTGSEKEGTSGDEPEVEGESLPDTRSIMERWLAGDKGGRSR